ncbi:hypothetical protein NACSLCCMFF_190038 [Tenacibaculum maritimum]|uniref:hypothetical protein n=1 Tax=Tenacibaculum TaxID=104267 RepID=UPI0012E5DA43|nr:hypothetical protein [Tenacibaculum maritimum]CAA0176771.1 hypothetical protein NACSLCCMFF_190038 [Tenacibaculum maritimum]
MKKLLTLFITVIFLGIGFAQEKENLSPEEKAKREKNIQAGNPFKKFGYTPKIATLSKGKYLEFHDLDSIVPIGSVMYNVYTQKIVSFRSIDSLGLSEATLKPEVISRWLSPDPLAEEFTSWSPYNFVYDNPIRYVDPTGLAPEDIIIRGANNSSITIVTDLIDIDVNAGGLLGDLGGNYSFSGDDILTAGLDIVGVVDPSPVSDGLAASLEFKNGNYGSALLSGAGIIPYIGDVGKLGKIPKHVKTINKAIESAKTVHGNSKLSEKAQHVYEIVNKTTNKVEKVGISSGKISKKGNSYRATSQVNKLNKAGGNYTSRIAKKIPAGKGARQKALQAEQRITNKNKKTLNPLIHKRPKAN